MASRRLHGYPLNMMRLSAAVLRCRWEFIRSPQQEFILNDRGYAGLLHQAWGAPALLVPLRRDSAVVFARRRRGRQVPDCMTCRMLVDGASGCTLDSLTETSDLELTGPEAEQ